MKPPSAFPRRKVGLWLTAAILCASALPALAGDPPPLPPLTTVSGNPRLPGKFVWADLVTDNVPAATKFYGALFGWTFYAVGPYVIAANDERPLCGMFQRPRPADQPEAKPRWFGYISVPNIDRAERAVGQAGGKVLSPPAKFPKRGEQAVCRDPEGALFGLIKSSSGDPEDFLASPGDWIWMQLLSHDARNAAEFYRAVAGYEIVENTHDNRINDFVLTSKGYARATIRALPDAAAKAQPTWLPFVRVAKASEAVARTRELGGTILFEPRPEYLGGRVAVVADPTGAAIGLLEWSEDLLQGGRQP